MEGWAAAELGQVQFGDERLRKRLIQLVRALAANPTASVPEARGRWSATKAAYRFWDSEKVTPEAIRAAHRQATVERTKPESLVLVIQDTTNLDFAHHPATRGLGPLDNTISQGLKVHSSLAVSAQGVPLGLLHQAVWARDPEETGKRHRRRQLQTEDKESQRWLTAMLASESAVPEDKVVVMIADREADIYDLLALPRRAGSELLIRAEHNRRVNDGGHLWRGITPSRCSARRTSRLGRSP